MLATFFPLPTLTLLGDVPPPLPAGAPFDLSTLPHWLQVVFALLTALGALLPLFAGLAAGLNRYEAALLERGEKPSPFFDALVVAVNRVALNSSRVPRDGGSGRGTYDVANDGNPEVKP